MAVSPYFNHISHPGEQKLAEDLVVEFIQQRGVDVYYIPRELLENIEMFNESAMNRFSQAKLIEMYVESITNFNGDGDLFSKFGGFGFEDSAVFMVSKKRFEEELVGLREEPTNGDLIYLIFADQFFEVQKRLEDEDYRQLGVNRTYRLKLTKFKYGHEDMDTGIPEIDALEGLYDIPDLDELGVTNTNDPRDTREEIKSTPEVQNDFVEFGR